MPLLRLSGRLLLQDSQSGHLPERLSELHQEKFSHNASASEVHSWRNSLLELGEVLRDTGLEQVEVLVEHRLPFSSLRADAILAGQHPETGEASYVIIELSQWSRARLEPESNDLCLVGTTGGSPRLHPLEQVDRYREYLQDFTVFLAGSADGLAGVAYLHNANESDVEELLEYPQEKHLRLFTATTRDALLDYLGERLSPAPGAPAADALLKSSVAPSRQLMRLVAQEVSTNEQFTLLNEQQVAASLVKRAVSRSHRTEQKEVIIVSGGPGTGKSVIAVQLLGHLARNGRTVLHATGSRSFTTTLRHTAGKGNRRVQKLFRYFNNFTSTEHDGVDVLICDEAHRIRQTSNNRFTPASKRSTRRQLEELLDAARVPVFLLDEHQVVRPGEIGTIDAIREAARDRGFVVHHVDLNGQFRCGGSRNYEQWVSQLMSLVPGGPRPWKSEDEFQVRVACSPQEMEDLLRSRQDAGFTARITAGFCWPWSSPSSDGTLVEDIVIGEWRRPWNLQGDRPMGGVPASALWATDPAGFGQVGCIYTAQGFEYDWNGVIFGPDLVWRTDGWRANSAASRDTVVRAAAADFDPLIRNTYKVLLTRGMVGTVVYSTDPETQAKFQELL
ncbi:ATP-binding protein [Frankia sp. CcI49]|uniref:DUF2075 domain-containing protein n=1 Tax=Frankia sp. CcI49 TaxID=1745382 RepID=UPI00097543B1|nr:DUF2075 domain-containing protein [Frankia sp. CcI49]ONH59046.1 ATP-binding protein [Frankia sp. CcI49]